LEVNELKKLSADELMEKYDLLCKLARGLMQSQLQETREDLVDVAGEQFDGFASAIRLMIVGFGFHEIAAAGRRFDSGRIETDMDRMFKSALEEQRPDYISARDDRTILPSVSVFLSYVWGNWVKIAEAPILEAGRKSVAGGQTGRTAQARIKKSSVAQCQDVFNELQTTHPGWTRSVLIARAIEQCQLRGIAREERTIRRYIQKGDLIIK
jgi:hypothetical protein